MWARLSFDSWPCVECLQSPHLVMSLALLRRRDLCERPHDTIDDVINICEVALQLTLLWALHSIEKAQQT